MSGDSSSSFSRIAKAASTSTTRSTTTNTKFKVEKFDSKNNFNIWQCKVMDGL